MNIKINRWFHLFALLNLLAAPAISHASISTYYLDWSGATTVVNPNAQAHAVLTVDNSVFGFNSSGVFDTAANLGIVDFSIVVSGTGAGDGSFGLTDFDAFSWDTAGNTLDNSQEMVGQSVNGGSWGIWVQPFGDFNFLASATSNAPTLFGAYVIASANGTGPTMSLASFRPALVPVPGAVWLFGSVLAGWFSLRTKRAAS